MWLGLTDIGTEGDFKWVTGPEGETNGCTYNLEDEGPQRTSCNIFGGQSSSCVGSQCKGGKLAYRMGTCQPDMFCNFHGAEPNDGNGGEDFIYATRQVGTWNDIAPGNTVINRRNYGVLCEWGGLNDVCFEDAAGAVCVVRGGDPLSSGVPGQNSPASCELDECALPCDTCAQSNATMVNVCLAADQQCHDYDMTATSLGDWECRCFAPSTT